MIGWGGDVGDLALHRILLTLEYLIHVFSSLSFIVYGLERSSKVVAYQVWGAGRL